MQTSTPKSSVTTTSSSDMVVAFVRFERDERKDRPENSLEVLRATEDASEGVMRNDFIVDDDDSSALFSFIDFNEAIVEL